MHYEDLIRESAPDWPYPVNYGKENEVSCDVLVPGGGISRLLDGYQRRQERR